MRILAIDTALANCAVAVLDTEADGAAPVVVSEEIGRGHAERLMDMIAEAMAEASCVFSALDRIAVTTGPGSFTGMRVGLSVARGFGLVLGMPVVGITTLSALAAPHLEAATTPLYVALEGKGDEVYGQLFGADGIALSAPEVRRMQDLAAFLPADVRLAGTIAPRIAEVTGLGPERVISDAAYPDVRDVAQLGLSANPQTDLPVPLYLRPPDAAPQKQGKIARQ